MPRLKNIESFTELTDHLYDDIKNEGYHYE